MPSSASLPAVPGVGFAVESSDRGYLHDRTYAEDTLPGARVVAVEDLVGEPVLKLLVRHPTMGPDELLAAAREVAGGLAELTHSSSDGLLEVSAAGVTKAATLATVAEQFGVQAADVLAFGDMPNDLAMLLWAGHGVAMGNAHPALLDAADEVTASNADDGFAVVLERWF